MPKRMLLFALALALLAPAVWAGQDEIMRTAQMYLTEVFGYTQEQADAFMYEDKGQGLLRFWDKAHPGWEYTIEYQPGTGEVLQAYSPFYLGDFAGFPGEAAIRDVLRQAQEAQWFSNWNQAAMDAFAQSMKAAGHIRPTLLLSAGLQSGDITAAQALSAFFDACFGEEGWRQPAANEWLAEILAQNGLKREADYQFRADRAVVMEVFPDEFFTFLPFSSQVPEAIKPALAHKRLESWACVIGGVTQRQKPGPNTYDSGLAIFEKDGCLLLAMLIRLAGENWRLVPVSEQALPAGQDFTITPQARYALGFVIGHSLSPTETQFFHVNTQVDGRSGRFYCGLGEYRYQDSQSGYSLQAVNSNAGWEIAERLNGKDAQSLSIDGALFGYMEAIPGFAGMPRSLAEWRALPERLTPAGYAMLAGVRLRQHTSTRSRELGDFLPGTLINDLGREQGDPFPWLKGTIGNLSGYVSTLYVNPPEAQGGQSITWTKPLPVARAIKDTALKSGTGLLDGRLQDLPKGSRMHVLSEQGDWLYVCIPRGEPGWLMDVEGAYGYVHKNDVQIAATAIQLDWLD